jgi:hypothetical protein
MIQDLSAEINGLKNVKHSKNRVTGPVKSSAVSGRDVATTAARCQPHSGVSGSISAPKNIAGHGAPRSPRSAHAPLLESGAPCADALARTVRKLDAGPVTAPDSDPDPDLLLLSAADLLLLSAALDDVVSSSEHVGQCSVTQCKEEVEHMDVSEYIEYVFISGASGPYCEDINGIFQEWSSTPDPSYQRWRGSDCLCIEYLPKSHKDCSGQWQITTERQQKLFQQGTRDCIAFSYSDRPEIVHASGTWYVKDSDKKFNHQPEMLMLMGTEALNAHAAAVARLIRDDNLRAEPVFIDFPTDCWTKLKGFYEPTERRGCDGRAIYQKRGNDQMILEHHTTRDLGHDDSEWRIYDYDNDHGYDSGWEEYERCCAKIHSHGCALDTCFEEIWEVLNGICRDPDRPSFCLEPSVKMWTGRKARLQVRCYKVALEFIFSFSFSQIFSMACFDLCRRMKHMSPPLRAPFLTTTLKLCLYLSVAPVAPTPKKSTVFSNLQKREVVVAVSCTLKTAMTVFASSIIWKSIANFDQHGKSSTCHQRAHKIIWHLFKAYVHWRHVQVKISGGG